MAGEDGEIMFDGVSEVLGADVFLSDGTVEHLDKPRLEEPLFDSASEGATASAGQLLSGFFQQTNSSPQDYATRQALDEAKADGTSVTVTPLEVRFGDGNIKFRQGERLADPERVVFELQLTIRQHRGK